MQRHLAYEVHIDLPDGGDTALTLWVIEEDGQYGHLDTRLFGPFETSLDIAQHLTKCVTKDLALRMR